MFDFFAQCLKASPHADDALLVVTAPAPLGHARSFLASGDEAMFWSDAERSRGAWVFAGLGTAVSVDGAGPARLATIEAQARRTFARLVMVNHPVDTGAPLPRLFGGVAFCPEVERTQPWTAFADASFTMPRWLYATNGERAFVRFTARASEVRDRIRVAAFLKKGQAALARVVEGRASSVEPRIRASIVRTAEARWCALVGDALSRIRARELEKVVPAALCRVHAQRDFDLEQTLRALEDGFPECWRFAFERAGAAFLGASPETLISKTGLRFQTDALAGTTSRVRGHDEAAIASLLGSDKDRREHTAVVDAIARELAPVSAKLDVPLRPHVRSLRNVHHLFTPISGTLSGPMHVLGLVALLHPTPAVAGTPREAALSWIAANEEAARGWFAGAVGWFDAEGDGNFAVAIRSGVLTRREAWLYAGAGIVEGSDANAEYEETRAKQTPMLNALGVVV